MKGLKPGASYPRQLFRAYPEASTSITGILLFLYVPVSKRVYASIIYVFYEITYRYRPAREVAQREN